MLLLQHHYDAHSRGCLRIGQHACAIVLLRSCAHVSMGATRSMHVLPGRAVPPTWLTMAYAPIVRFTMPSVLHTNELMCNLKLSAKRTPSCSCTCMCSMHWGLQSLSVHAPCMHVPSGHAEGACAW